MSIMADWRANGPEQLTQYTICKETIGQNLSLVSEDFGVFGGGGLCAGKSNKVHHLPTLREWCNRPT